MLINILKFTLLLLLLSGCDDKNAPTKDIVTFNNQRFTNNLSAEQVIPNKFISSKEKIRVVFSAPLNKELFSVLHLKLQNKTTNSPIEVEFQISKNQFSIVPIESLTLGQTYILTINDSLQDNLGNTLQKTFVHEFICVRDFLQDYYHRNVPQSIQDLEHEVISNKTVLYNKPLENINLMISVGLIDSYGLVEYSSYISPSYIKIK